MGIREESIVREFCDAWGQGERAPDVEKIVSMFAPGGYWQLYMPSGPKIQGRTALRAEVLRQMSYVDKPECNILHMISSSDAVVTERRDYFTKNEKNNVEFNFTVAGYGFYGTGQNTGITFTRLKDFEQRKGKQNSAQAITQRAMGHFMMNIKDAQVFSRKEYVLKAPKPSAPPAAAKP